MSNSYRKSHSDAGYGEVYKKSYESGYNFFQWEYCEKPLLTALFKQLEQQYGGASLLDFACGAGRITNHAATIFNNCTGVDVSETMLEQAKLANNDVTFIHRDITKQPLDGEYDVVTAFRFFNNAERELARDALISLKSNMRHDSKLVFNGHRNADGLLSKLYSLRKIKTDSTSAKFFHLDDARELLSETGFKIDDVTWYSFLPKLSRYPDWFLKIGFRQIENVILKVFPFSRKYSQCFLITASISAE